MSDPHGQDHGEHAGQLPGEEKEGGHGSWRIYATGFGLSVLQTALAFAVAQQTIMSHEANIAAIACLAIGQMLVHLIFFIHLSTSPDAAGNTAALAYAVAVIVLIVGGSIWIMSQMNGNMMPAGSPMTMG